MENWVFPLSASGSTLQDMDFEEDRMALEAYIREKTQWRDEDEVSEEEWAYYAHEYMELNPFPSEFVLTGNEFIFYQRWDGSFKTYKMNFFIPFAWEHGKFWQGQKDGIANFAPFVIARKLLEYFGLIEVRDFQPPELASADG